MNMVQLLDSIILYIEYTEVMRAEEFSYGESLDQLIHEKKMPHIYHEAIEYRDNLLKLINDANL